MSSATLSATSSATTTVSQQPMTRDTHPSRSCGLKIGQSLSANKVEISWINGEGKRANVDFWERIKDYIPKGGHFVLITMPCAFSPTCDGKHLPDIVKNVAAFRDKKSAVGVMTTDSIHSIQAWFEKHKAGDAIVPLSDADCEFGMYTKLVSNVRTLGEVLPRGWVILAEGGVVKDFYFHKVNSDCELAYSKPILQALTDVQEGRERKSESKEST